VLDIAQARPDWVMRNYIEEAVARIRAQVGRDEVILGLSGGVDSSVAAALIHRAIGEQLTCVFVDHGLLRLNEAAMVMEMFAGRLHAKVDRGRRECAVPRASRRRHRPGAKRKDHRARIRRGVPGRGEETRCGKVASPRHDLPRRDRERPARRRRRR